MMSLAVFSSERRTSSFSCVRLIFLKRSLMSFGEKRDSRTKPVCNLIVTFRLDPQLATLLPDVFVSISVPELEDGNLSALETGSLHSRITLLSTLSSEDSLNEFCLARDIRVAECSLYTLAMAPACSLGVPSWRSSWWRVGWSTLLAAADLSIQQRAVTRPAVISIEIQISSLSPSTLSDGLLQLESISAA